MPERKGRKICKATAENIRILVEVSLKYHSEVTPEIVEIIRDWARHDHDLHEMYRGTGGPLDIY